MASSACARSGLSVAGLMPMTASPAPSSSPSRMLAAMPRGIVGRMVGLQPHREPARQADGVAEARDHAALRRHHHQVLQPADLADRRGHLRREAGRERGEGLRRRRIRQEPVAKSADGEMRDRGEGRAVVAVDDQPRHLVALVRNDGIVEKAP